MRVSKGATIRYAGLDATVLEASHRGDGRNLTLKTVLNGKAAVVKIYGQRRGFLITALRWFDSRVIAGKSSDLPRARCETERSVLELWRRTGFDVPAILEDALPETTDRHVLVIECVPGDSLRDLIKGRRVTDQELTDILERFARDCRRRHDTALALKEPRLIHEHPSLRHVMVADDRLINLDFEVVFMRRHDIERIVSLEIAGFLRALAKETKEIFPRYLEAFARAYGDKERLARVGRDVRGGTLPIFKWLITLDLKLRRRVYYNKLTVADALSATLEGCIPAQRTDGRVGWNGRGVN